MQHEYVLTKPAPFGTAKRVSRYVNRRYQTRGQRLVDRREQSLLKNLLLRHFGYGGLRVLDAPCGYGRMLPLLKSLGYRLVLADIAEEMLRHVRGLPELPARTELVQGDLRQMNLPTGSVDLVLTIRLLQHLKNEEQRQRVLGEIARLTRRWAVVSFYDRRSLHHITKWSTRWLQGRTYRVNMTTRNAFAAEAARAGLVVREYLPLQRGLHAQTFALLERAA